MNIRKLNQLPVTDFLSKIGIEPRCKKVKITGTCFPFASQKEVQQKTVKKSGKMHL